MRNLHELDLELQARVIFTAANASGLSSSIEGPLTNISKVHKLVASSTLQREHVAKAFAKEVEDVLEERLQRGETLVIDDGSHRVVTVIDPRFRGKGLCLGIFTFPRSGFASSTYESVPISSPHVVATFDGKGECEIAIESTLKQKAKGAVHKAVIDSKGPIRPRRFLITAYHDLSLNGQMPTSGQVIVGRVDKNLSYNLSHEYLGDTGWILRKRGK